MPLATPTRRMPRADKVRDFLSDLIGKQAIVKQRDPIDVNDPGAVMYTATLIDDSGNVGGLFLADISFACYSGACLVLIPKGAADDAIEAGAMSDSLNENFHEIANIMTGLVNGPIVSHLRVGGVEPGVTEAAKSLAIKAAGRRFFDIEIPEYGDGMLAMYAM